MSPGQWIPWLNNEDDREFELSIASDAWFVSLFRLFEQVPRPTRNMSSPSHPYISEWHITLRKIELDSIGMDNSNGLFVLFLVNLTENYAQTSSGIQMERKDGRPRNFILQRRVFLVIRYLLEHFMGLHEGPYIHRPTRWCTDSQDLARILSDLFRDYSSDDALSTMHHATPAEDEVSDRLWASAVHDRAVASAQARVAPIFARLDGGLPWDMFQPEIAYYNYNLEIRHRYLCSRWGDLCYQWQNRDQGMRQCGQDSNRIYRWTLNEPV